ncbi:MAG TPA: 50S ribosomal protein L4 [Chloroflexota bacterium]|nr:50S ribosomal protein L4 [Chloroflexota bacterium]
MPDVTVFNAQGAPNQTITLREDVFGGAPNEALLHQAVLRQLANRRQGTHDTQTRGEVSRTTKKVWRQKGTGRARQGSRKGPHWTGGGVAFGPHPRSHRQGFPRKMVAAAIRSALASKAADNQIALIESFAIDRPSTKQMAALINTVAPQRSVLLLLEGPNRPVQLSARNLPNVTFATVENVNAYDLLRHQQVLLTVAAARHLEQRYGAAEAAEGAGAADDTSGESASQNPAEGAGGTDQQRAGTRAGTEGA